MDDLPTVSVIIPAYNAECFLERAVQSVFATGYPEINVLIVDDGSADATARIAERLCANWPAQCRLLQHADRCNHGVSSSRNLGINASTSEWIAFLDADDFYLPHRFGALESVITSHQQVDAIYELCEIRSDEHGRPPSPQSNEGGTTHFGITESLQGSALLSALLQGQCWATSAITIRRNLLARTGLFDPQKRIAEDCDLWFRLAAAGIVVPGNLAAAVSVYWRHQNNTYHYKPAHRVAMLKAMLDSWQWAREIGVTPELLSTFRSAIPRYVHRSVIALREMGHPSIAWKLLLLMARHGHVRYLLQLETLKQALGLLRDRKRARVASIVVRERQS